MKKFLTIIGVSAISSMTLAQETHRYYDSLAFDCDRRKRPDSAIFFYKKSILFIPAARPWFFLNAYNDIANCYLELKDTTNALNYFLQALNYAKADSVTSGWLYQRLSATEAIGNIYFARNKYAKALDYFRLAKDIAAVKAKLDRSPWTPIKMAYKKATCFYLLNQTDSVILELAPLLIYSSTSIRDYELHDPSYDSIVRFYVNSLFENYGKQATKCELINSLTNLNYAIQYKEKDGVTYVSSTCYMTFFNIRIDLVKSNYYQIVSKGKVHDFQMKENIVQKFESSTLYKYIMTDEYGSR